MNGRKSTFARRFAWENKNLPPSIFLIKVEELHESLQVKKKAIHEYRVLRRQAGMPSSADPK